MCASLRVTETLGPNESEGGSSAEVRTVPPGAAHH